MNQKKVREKAIRDAKIGLILDASQKVFAQKGYHQARLEDIGEAAGFSKTALYGYFSDKEEIFLSLAVREHEKIATTVEEAASEGGNAIECLQKITKNVIRQSSTHFAFSLAVNNYQTSTIHQCEICRHESLAAKFHQVISRAIEKVTEVIELGKAKGEITVPLESSVIARMIATLVQGVFSDWKKAGKMGNVEKAGDQIAIFLKCALQEK